MSNPTDMHSAELGVRTHRGAFTLIELLIVLAVIATLAAMLLPVLSMVRTNAKLLATSQRMEEVLRTAQAVPAGTQGQAAALMKALGEGVEEFATNPANGTLTPLAGAWLTAAPHRFAVPWSQPGLEPVSGAAVTALSPLAARAAPHGLAELSPSRAEDLLLLAGIIPETLTYRSDRSAGRAWNDRWGHPLSLAYGVYQPFANTTISTTRRTLIAKQLDMGNGTAAGLTHEVKTAIFPDLFLVQATQAYAQTRAVYLAVAAAGPVLSQELQTGTADSAWLGTDGNPARIWNQVNRHGNRQVPNDDASDELWRTDFQVWTPSTPAVTAFANPPWTAIKRTRAAGQITLLSAPVEVK